MYILVYVIWDTRQKFQSHKVITLSPLSLTTVTIFFNTNSYFSYLLEMAFMAILMLTACLTFATGMYNFKSICIILSKARSRRVCVCVCVSVCVFVV